MTCTPSSSAVRKLESRRFSNLNALSERNFVG